MVYGKQTGEKEAHTQLSYAFDLGINFLDTAEMYPVPPAEDTQGNTDRYIASWLPTRKRDDVIIATKVRVLLRALCLAGRLRAGCEVHAGTCASAKSSAMPQICQDMVR